jgi:hypothetical protein
MEGVSLGDEGTELSFEAESDLQQAIRQVTKRWKNWGTIAVTAVTAWFLYGINDAWTKDAGAFALITVALLGYTLVTLYSDVEML